MGQFILTEQAALDIDEIWEYVADSNIEAADKVINELYVAMRKLSDQPSMGRARLELADERHRFWVAYPYLIAYRLETNPLQIIRVVHGARDLDTVLNQ